jgi:Phage tail tube protein
MPTGYLRAAIESEPGNEVNTPTLSTKKVFPELQSFTPKPGVKPMERDDELRGQDEPLLVLPEVYEPTWAAAMRMYPDPLGLFLSLCVGPSEDVKGNGIITDLAGVVIPTGAFRHRWAAPFGPSGANPLTAQFDVAYKDQGVFRKMKGAALESLGITNPDTGGVSLALSGPAAYYDSQGDPSLTPAYETLTIRPFTKSNLVVKGLSAGGEIDDFTLNIANPVEVHRSLGIASRWPDKMEKADSGPIVVSGTIPKRFVDTDDLTALKEATGFELLATYVSDTKVGATAFPYKFAVKCANAQYVDGEEGALENKRRIGASYSWKSTTASVGSTTFELVNATESYA